MCGIAGLLSIEGAIRTAPLELTARAMAAKLSHRGPDDSSEWFDSDAGIAFGHRRLSILGLGAAGRQPMLSKSGRFVLCYNGEIYNFRELRVALTAEGCSFRSQTDTEVLLEAIDAWGIPRTLERANGMFAFGLWDRQERRLYLARDAFGIKPLCVGVANKALYFASELRAIKAIVPSLQIDAAALKEFLTYGFVSAPRSIYSSVWKVMPGTVLCFSIQNSAPPESFVAAPEHLRHPMFQSVSQHTFWSHSDELERGAAEPNALPLEEAADELDAILRRALTRQQVADVPIGAFLSGGIDSSSVVSVLQAVRGTPLKTYTIGFEDTRLDESPFASRVAKHLGTEHTELRVSEAKALETARRVGRIYDEPFADSSQIPTLLVSELAASGAKVVITGDGGDELFGGYNRHVYGIALWQKLQSLTPGARQAIAGLAGSKYWRDVDRIAGGLLFTFLPALSHRSAENAAGKLAKIANSQTISELYSNLITANVDSGTLLTGDATSTIEASLPSGLSDVRKLMLLDSLHYLPNDILTKVDRATMSASIEARVPLLDVEVARFAARLPEQHLIKGSSGKIILKQVLKRYLPEELTDRSKMGFAVPLKDWLRGPLKEWSTGSIATAESRFPDLLQWKTIRSALTDFYSGNEDTSAKIWTWVMLAEWLQSQES